MVNLDLTVVYKPDGLGGWIARILEIDGALSIGRTKDEAREKVFDAARELLAYRGRAAAKEHEAAEARETIALALVA